MASQIQFLFLFTIFYGLLAGGVFSDDVTKIIQEFGYPNELHSVRTKDGNILGVHRIPFSRFRNYSKRNREPVLMMHGLQSSSADWVIAGRKISLAFQLADSGYDVWMCNARGNTYSKNHISKSTESNEFWNFSMDEIGKIDVPTTIDYILNKTKHSSLFYVGYSQGTTVIMIALSALPEYNSKIKTAILLAPSAYMKRFPNPLFQMKIFNPAIKMVGSLASYFEVLPKSDMLFIREHCQPNDETKIIYQLCKQGIYLLAGPSENANMSLLSKIAKTCPAGASSKQFIHYSQIIMSGKLQSFDYQENNLKHYGQITNPEYKLSKIKAPMAVFYGTSDNLVNWEDAEDVIKDLKNVVGKFKIENWNHIDFVYATNVYKVVNSKVLRIFNNFRG